MTNYYIEKDNKIVLFDSDRQKLKKTLTIMPELAGLEIKKSERPIVDFQFADTEEYITEKLNIAKTNKYTEINNGARIYLESGNALYELEEGKHIEATDGNIAKLSAYALSFLSGASSQSEVYWNTKEDETIALNQEQLTAALMGLGEVQATVWNVKFPYYLKLLEEAQTIEEVNAINVDYSQDVPTNDDNSSPIEENEVTENDV